ncbi:MAG TPA: DUF3999 family protein [Bryobacteraceae bacterium]
MKKRASSLAACVLGCGVLLWADFQPERWKYRRALPADTGAQVVALNLDRGILVNAQPDLADLRVVRGGDEIPYVLERMTGSHQHEELPSRILEQGVASSGNFQLTVDVLAGRRHNGIRLATSRINFRQRVRIEISDDRRDWTIARDDGSIFDFAQDDRRISILDVAYPPSSRRYIRVTVYGWDDPKAVTQCWVTIEEDKPPMRDVMASLQTEPRQDAKTQSTVYTWDLGVSGIPHDELSVNVGTPAFERAAVVETSVDGKHWTALGSGVLSRFSKEESLKLNFPESHERYVRLRIYNRDDRPLDMKAAVLSVTRSRVKFKPVGAGPYWLYYGNPDARVPQYDLRDLLAREPPGTETSVSAGVDQRNPAYREKPPAPKPWSERHPEILYITLAIAVAGMGTVTVRFLLKAKADSR